MHDKCGPAQIEGPKRKNQKRKRNQSEKEKIIAKRKR
jgi:hypothetical protein